MEKTHEYRISGMTCGSCEAKVKSSLLGLDGVFSAEVSKQKESAIIEMQEHFSITTLQNALGGDSSRYQITPVGYHEAEEDAKGWMQTYFPVILIFFYILGITVLIEMVKGDFIPMRWMNHFMAGFFITFSFFKLLNLLGFAESYAMYDIVAGKWMAWGYIYAFMELALGLSFLTGFAPVLTNAVTFIVMTISITGVLRSVLNKKKIKCACLGAVFNLPMSTITIIEDALMIGMSGLMLTTMLS